jgi:DNA modification methylase
MPSANGDTLTMMSAAKLRYSTENGQAWLGDAATALREVCAPGSADLIVTSPPFALLNQKDYGNESQDDYVRWFQPFADEFWRVLKPTGSLVIDLGGSWEPGRPVKSLYAFELLISLCRRPQQRFHLAQDFYWYNPARLPTPAAWVTVRRLRAKDSINYVWWLSKTPEPKADNSRVTREYTRGMKRLIETGTYNRGRRPSGHVVREGFTRDRGGAIPPNLLCVSNTGSDAAYVEACKATGRKTHPARFAPDVPAFFIEMLTDPGDLVIDPFAGSNVTGQVAESLGRRWIAIEIDRDYLEVSAVRFDNLQAEIPNTAARARKTA